VVVQSMRRRVRRVRKNPIDQTHRAASLACDRRERQPRLGIARPITTGTSGFMIPPLLARDGRDRVAEIFHVIETNRSDHAQDRRHDVGGIQPPAKSGLDHGDIDVLLREVEEHHRDGELKKRERHAARS